VKVVKVDGLLPTAPKYSRQIFSGELI